MSERLDGWAVGVGRADPLGKPKIPSMPKVATAAVAIALLYVNFAGIHYRDWRGYDTTGYSYYHFGWPTTWRVITGEFFETYSLGKEPADPICRTTFLGPLHLAVNALWGIAIPVGTWAGCREIEDAVRRTQFSLRFGFLIVTAGAIVLFLVVHYQQTSQEWTEYVIGQPYLPLSGVYRWFGPRGSYDWLFHFGLLVRFPILTGWLLTVCVFFSRATTVVGTRFRREE